MPEGAGGTEPRTWTIYVCPACGKQAEHEGQNTCGWHPGLRGGAIAIQVVRVVEQQPPTEGRCEDCGEVVEVVGHDELGGDLYRCGCTAPPGPPEPTRGNEWDPATVDAVSRFVRGIQTCGPVELTPELVAFAIDKRFKGAARDA